MEIHPHGYCFDGFVWRLRLLVASVPGSPAGGRDGACLTLDRVVRCSSTSGAEFEFWRPGPSVGPQFALFSGNWKTSRFFRGYGSGFLPPTAGRSFIGGTSAWSGPLLRVTAISLAFGLATAVFLCGDGFTHGYGWSPVFPSFGSGRRCRLSTLDALCTDRNLFPVNPGLFWTFLGVGFQRACAGLLLPRPLGACRSTLRLFTGWFLLAMVASS